MDADNFAPNDERACKHEQAKIRGVFFLEANEQFAETVDKRVRDFHNPAPRFEVRIALKLKLFLAAWADMRDEPTLLHFLLRADEARVDTEVLRVLMRRQRAENHNVIKGLRQ